MNLKPMHLQSKALDRWANWIFPFWPTTVIKFSEMSFSID